MKKLVVFLTVLCVALITCIILMITGVIKCDCTKKEETTTTKEVVLDAKKLAEIKDADYKAIKVESTHMNSYALTVDGKVVIDFDREITNVTDPTDIVLFGDNLYILTKAGDVYKYFTGVTKKATLDATKVDTVKDVKKLVDYTVRKKNAGGCNYVVAIDKDDKYTQIEEFCV